jgi:hypothetical protein
MMVAAGTSTQADLASGELRHHAILVGAAHLAVHQADLVAKACLQAFKARFGVGEIDGIGFLHQRADPVN